MFLIELIMVYFGIWAESIDAANIKSLIVLLVLGVAGCVMAWVEGESKETIFTVLITYLLLGVPGLMVIAFKNGG